MPPNSRSKKPADAGAAVQATIMMAIATPPEILPKIVPSFGMRGTNARRRRKLLGRKP
jgi:hypothetical protein